jgi:hypothetical protein
MNVHKKSSSVHFGEQRIPGTFFILFSSFDVIQCKDDVKRINYAKLRQPGSNSLYSGFPGNAEQSYIRILGNGRLRIAGNANN